MTSSSISPRQAIDAILVTARLQQAMSVAAGLGIPDLLADGPRGADDMASAIGANEDALYRLLGTLAAGGILHEDDDSRFGLTEVGALLRSGVPGSMREWAILNGKAYVCEGWSHLEHSIRTGENAFSAIHGENVWSWRSTRPDESAAFDRAMAGTSGAVAQAVAEAYDFGPLGTLVDVGGGTGTLLAAILRRHPTLRGILFDQAHVASGDAAQALLEREGVAERCEAVAGSFFEAVPAGAGGYLMKSILHDWEDDEAIRILRTVRAAALPTSQLFVAEVVIGAPNEDLASRILDLHMLVMPGGRERTEKAWRSLFERSGWQLTDVRPTATSFRILIGTP
ncbi:MAG: methyltransferase [Chloroflexota bacterium]